MADMTLYTLRHVGGALDGTIIDVVQDESGKQHLRVREGELHVVLSYSGGPGTVELVTTEKDA
jgi:hypothetical protein